MMLGGAPLQQQELVISLMGVFLAAMTFFVGVVVGTILERKNLVQQTATLLPSFHAGGRRR